VNRGFLEQQRKQNNALHPPQQRTAIVPTMRHPHRALEPGKQWLPHCGARQRARALKQQRAAELKRLRQSYASSSITGTDGQGALLLDFPTPVRGQQS